MCGLKVKHIERTGTTASKLTSRSVGRIEGMKVQERFLLEALRDATGSYSLLNVKKPLNFHGTRVTRTRGAKPGVSYYNRCGWGHPVLRYSPLHGKMQCLVTRTTVDPSAPIPTYFFVEIG